MQGLGLCRVFLRSEPKLITAFTVFSPSKTTHLLDAKGSLKGMTVWTFVEMRSSYPSKPQYEQLNGMCDCICNCNSRQRNLGFKAFKNACRPSSHPLEMSFQLLPGLHVETDSTRITCLAFSPSGSQLACGDDDGSIVIYAIPSGDKQCSFVISQTPEISSLLWHPYISAKIGPAGLIAGTSSGTIHTVSQSDHSFFAICSHS